MDGAWQSGSRQDSGEHWRGRRSQRGLHPAGMADPQAPGPAGEGKKKRRVKKKAPAQPGAVAAAHAQPAAPAKPEPPARRPKLTLEDRQHYDFIRECTVKNVWCAERGSGQHWVGIALRCPGSVALRAHSCFAEAQVLQRPAERAARALQHLSAARVLGARRHRRAHAGVGPRPGRLAAGAQHPHARAPNTHGGRCGPRWPGLAPLSRRPAVR